MNAFIRAVIATLLLAVPAAAHHGTCNTRAFVASMLAVEYQETRRAMALTLPETQPATLLEIYAGEPGGTWTITVTKPGGLTCIVAAGTSWQPVRDAAPVPGAPG